MSDASEVSFRRLAFVAALGVTLLLGAIDAAYGPLLRTISLRFSVSFPTAGTVLSAVSATSVTVVPVALSVFAALTFVMLLSVRAPGRSGQPSPGMASR